MVKSSSPPPRLRRPPPLTPACSGERFKGVRRRSWGRWVSEIRIPHSREKIWLGSYSTAEQAARAYDIASLLLRGLSCSAFLNFADSTTLVSADDQLAALVAGGVASPRTIQATASAAANSVVSLQAANPMQDVVLQEGAACSNDGSSHDIIDDENHPQSSETSTKDCSTGAQSHSTHLFMAENKRAAHAGVCNAMPGSCWIQDVLTLIVSPKDKTSPPSLNCSLQLSPSIAARCSASPSSLSTPILNSCQYGLQSSSSKTSTNPDNLLHMLLDDSQLYPLEDLLRDGFTAISPAVTTRKRFDTETVGSSCEVDSTQLWSYVR